MSIRFSLSISLAALAVNAAFLFAQSAGTIDTVAGNGHAGFSGDGGPAKNAEFGSPVTVAPDGKGNLYIGDQANARVRKVDTQGVITSVAGGGNGIPNGIPATQAYIAPDSIVIDHAGNMIIASGNQILKIDTNAIVTTVAGGPTNPLTFSGKSGPATQAGFLATDAAVDAAGNIYISDPTDNRILKVDISSGVLSSFAGNGKSGYAGDGGLATDATLALPQGLSVDLQGAVYFCDTPTGHVRKVAPNGVISTVAGNGSSIYLALTDDGQPATKVGMTPVWVTVDTAGNLFIVDPIGQVFKVDTKGIIHLFAGSALPGLPYGGDGGPATKANLFRPNAAAADNLGNVFIADSGNSRIREVYSGVKQPGAGSPSFTAAGVVNGASFATGGVVPGAIATIFGSNLTSHTGINLTSGLPLPTAFLGVSVKVNGTPAALFAVDNVNGQEQINFQVPWDVKGTASIEITNGTATSAPVTVPVLGAQPGIINYLSDGQSFGAILHANFQLADTAHPAKPGETVLIYCTGLGAVNSPPANGAASNGQKTVAKPVVAIGGNIAPVAFSGLAPGFVGLYQVNVEVPTLATSGNARVSMVIAGATGNSNIVLLPIQ